MTAIRSVFICCVFLNYSRFDLRYTNTDTIVNIGDTIKPYDKVNMTLTLIYDASYVEKSGFENVEVSGVKTKLHYDRDNEVRETIGK